MGHRGGFVAESKSRVDQLGGQAPNIYGFESQRGVSIIAVWGDRTAPGIGKLTGWRVAAVEYPPAPNGVTVFDPHNVVTPVGCKIS